MFRHYFHWLHPILVSTELLDQNATHVNGSNEYCENIATKMLFTTSSFVLSVPVYSIKMFVVLREILEWSPLMMGGREQTVRLESKITG